MGCKAAASRIVRHAQRQNTKRGKCPRIPDQQLDQSLDVWNYIKEEGLAIPSIYYAHTRPTFVRDNLLWPVSDFVPLVAGETCESRQVRFRTVGDMSCSAAIESSAATVDAIIGEIENAQTSERGARIDDKWSESAMELRKAQGYF